MDKEEAIRLVSKYADEIKDLFNVKELILFGSYAKDVPRKHSDIDVAVVVKEINGSLLDSEFLLHKLVRNIDLRIEPILFEEGNDPTGFLEELREPEYWFIQTHKKRN